MNHDENAIEIVTDAPISLRDFANCYPHLCYQKCGELLSNLVRQGCIERCKFGVYQAVM